MLFLLTSLAQAQDVTTRGDAPALSSQLFRPSIDADHTLWTDDTTRAAPGATSVRGMVHYMDDPVVYTSATGERTAVVDGLAQLSVTAAYTRGPVRLGVDLPLYLRSFGAVDETGLGDPALDAKVSILDRLDYPTGLAATVRVGLPVGTVSTAGDMTWEVAAVLDRQLNDKLFAAANLGVRGAPTVEFENGTWGNQVVLRAGAGYALSDATTASLDLASHMTIGGGSAARPAEVLAGATHRLSDTLVLRAGLGTALNGGVGAPRYRAGLGLGWAPAPVGERDRDNDGIADSIDSCRDRAEDLDGIKDHDGCPEPTVVQVHLEDEDGDRVSGGWSLAGERSFRGTSGQTSDMYGGTYQLAAEAAGYHVVQREEAIPDDDTHVIRVVMTPLAGVLTVQVVDGDGNPIEGAVWRSPQTDYAEAQAGVATEVPPGTIELVITAPGHEGEQTRRKIAAGAEETVVITLD